jgi:hypothetical protein
MYTKFTFEIFIYKILQNSLNRVRYPNILMFPRLHYHGITLEYTLGLADRSRQLACSSVAGSIRARGHIVAFSAAAPG